MAHSPSPSLTQRDLWSRLEQFGTQLTLRRQSVIYSPQQPAHTLYLLRSGQVSLHIPSNHDDRVLTLRVIEAGDLFGHSVLANDPTYDTLAETLRPSVVIAVPRHVVFAALNTDSRLVVPMSEALALHQRAISRKLDEVAFKSVPARLASVLLDMAETNPSAAQQSRVPRRTHQQLAEMINAYRETVTKVINQFRDARLLDVDHSGITLLNLSRLRELAQG